MTSKADMFESYFGGFSGSVFEKIRKDTYARLRLKPDDHVLDIASGSGGPAVFMSRELGVRVFGVDINSTAVETAQTFHEGRPGARVEFKQGDARQGLPFDNETFNAVVCMDSIQNIGNRRALLMECHRVLKSDGQVLFTDTHVISGIISIDEIAPRLDVKMHFDFTPSGANEELSSRVVDRVM